MGILSKKMLMKVMAGNTLPQMLMRDEFTTPLTAGAIDGTAAEPGVGIRKANDTSNYISIENGKLRFSGAKQVTGDPCFWLDGMSRVNGRTCLVKASKTNQSGVGPLVGFSNSNTGYITNGDGIYWNNTNLTMLTGVYSNLIGNVTQQVILCVILRSLSSLLFVELNGAWIYLGTWGSDVTPTKYPLFVTHYNTEVFADYIRIADLPAPFNDDYGLVTQRLAGARTAGETFTHEANALVYWTVTTRADGQQVAIRKQDDSNYWRVDVAADGSIALQEVVAGTPTSRGTGAAGSIANGQRMVVIADGTTIRVYANNVLKITYASATNFQAATAGKLLALGTGGAISDIITWPRYLSGAAADILDRYSK